jgi:type I restriction enzyme, S subunit
MKGWEVKTLDDLCEIARGGSPRPIKEFITDDPEGINWIKIADATASTKYIYETNQKIKPEGVHRSRMVHEGDFLLSNSMSFGRPYIMKTSGCIHDGWLVLSDKTGLFTQDYLYYFLGSKAAYCQFDSRAAGSTVRNLNIESVRSVEIPIPPLSEQERIVAILDEAFAAIDTATANTQKNLANAKDLFESYSDRMFNSLCDTLQEKTLDDVCENLDRQRVPITKSKRVSGLIPYYGASGVVDHVDKSLFDEDLLLVSEDGANLLARTYLIAFSISGPSWVNNHAHVLRFQSMAYQKFVEFYLNSISLEPFISGMAQPKLNQTKLNTIPIPWPENNQQASEVVNSLVAIESESNSVSELAEQKLSHYTNLKQSLLQKAFTGELTADPKVVDRVLSEAST